MNCLTVLSKTLKLQVTFIMRATKEGIIRKDGRRTNELRSIVCEHGHISSADGSCRFTMGGTSVIASIVGPQESNKYFDYNKIDKAHIDCKVQSVHGSGSLVFVCLFSIQKKQKSHTIPF